MPGGVRGCAGIALYGESRTFAANSRAPGVDAVGADSITTLRERLRWQMVPLLVGTVM